MIIKMKGEINTYALKVAREYRGYTQTELCKHIKGLYQPNLSRFEKGAWGVLNEKILKDVMVFLNFPFGFLHSDIKPVKTSWDL